MIPQEQTSQWLIKPKLMPRESLSQKLLQSQSKVTGNAAPISQET